MYVSYRLNKVYNKAHVDNDDDDGGGVGDDAGAAAADYHDNDRKLYLPRNFFFMSTGNSKNTSQKFLMTG